jgi:acyl-coenzyme A synthetase/AMP-(fatty) acid ligase
MPAETAQLADPIAAGWIDEVLLAGPGDGVCICLDDAIDRATLRALVGRLSEELAAAGLVAGGSIALRLPPSSCYVAALLASWRIGAQVILLDHRLTRHEVDRALERLAPQFIVEPDRPLSGPLRGFFDVKARVSAYPGRPADTPHVLIQLSSGSTGPSKIIARTATSLRSEIDRYTRIEGFPRAGERIVVLASMVHVLGMVGGLLYGLHAHVPVTIPERFTVAGILHALGADDRPTTLIGVPAQAELLAGIRERPELPQLVQMITGGELVGHALWERFTAAYGVPLGTMYGMTEVGVIATDIGGEHRPSLRPAPGMKVSLENGELLVAAEESPYLGLTDPTRWRDGWLHTKDAGTLDPKTGHLSVLGRLDSQVSVGGLKVDLTEVERVLNAVPGVENAVVIFDNGIKAYIALSPSVDLPAVHRVVETRLAPYKRPRVMHALSAMPRTTTGKLLRDPAALRAAAGT